MRIIEFLNTHLLGFCLPPFLLAAGLFFAVRLSFFPFRHPLRTLKKMGSDGGRRASVSALFVALAGTLGVGNIAGVGVALTVGGAGAVLWMVVGGLLAAFLKYAEIVLALDARKGDTSRGALDYIAPVLGEPAALLFALLTLALALTMGSLLQGQVIAEAVGSLLPLHPLSVGLLLSAITLLLMLGGERGIARLSGVLIPTLTVLYTVAALAVVFAHREALPAVMGRILREAFSFRSAGGGLVGLGIARTLRAGIGRGLFSNEAGAGTAPFAHSAVGHTSPAMQGLFGILEVLLDTVVMCTLTALAVLSSFDPLPALSGTALVAAAFGSVFGTAAEAMVNIAILLFAYATVACWVGYGRVALGHLSRRPSTRVAFSLAFLLLFALGTVCPAEGAWALADLVLGVMTLINTAAVVRRADRVIALSREQGLAGENALRLDRQPKTW